MTNTELKAFLEKNLTPTVIGLGFELVDLDWRPESPSGWVLRLYIDKPSGRVSLSDCEKVSRQIEAVLDEQDWIQHHYTLEISSPGLNRPLKKLSDYARFMGERVTIELASPYPGTNQKKLSGRIARIEGGEVWIEAPACCWKVAVEEIVKAHLDPEIVI